MKMASRNSLQIGVVRRVEEGGVEKKVSPDRPAVEV